MHVLAQEEAILQFLNFGQKSFITLTRYFSWKAPRFIDLFKEILQFTNKTAAGSQDLVYVPNLSRLNTFLCPTNKDLDDLITE